MSASMRAILHHPESKYKIVQKTDLFIAQSKLPASQQTLTQTSDYFEFYEDGVIGLQMFLISGRTYGYPGAVGFFSNLWCYYKNNHPLLSLIQANEYHPFDRTERAQFTYVMLSISFLLVVSFVPEGGEEAEEQSWNEFFFESFIVAVSTIPIGWFMQNILLTCSCCLGNSWQKRFECIGQYMMRVIILLSVILHGFSALTILSFEKDFSVIVQVFILAQLQGWLLEFLTEGLKFSLLYFFGKKKFRRQYPGLVSLEIEELPYKNSTYIEYDLEQQAAADISDVNKDGLVDVRPAKKAAKAIKTVDGLIDMRSAKGKQKKLKNMKR